MTAGATYSPTNRFTWLGSVPLAQLILETDGPYFPPRGAARQVALPGDVAHVAASVQAVYGVRTEPKPLGSDNIGYQLLVKGGWSPWSGLGLNENGIKIPVEAKSGGWTDEESEVGEVKDTQEVKDTEEVKDMEEVEDTDEVEDTENRTLKMLVDSTALLIDTFLSNS